MKVAILTCTTNNRKWLYDITNRTKELYCKNNNFEYIFSDTFYPIKERHPYWNKIKFIIDNLKNYDWVIWMDDDAGFIKNDSLTYVLNTDKEFLYTEDMNGFNAGVMFIKNTEINLNVFKFIWEKMYDEYKNHMFPEQDAIYKIITDLNICEKIDGHIFNAYNKSLTESIKNQENEKTIILHIAGGSDFKNQHKNEIGKIYECYK